MRLKEESCEALVNDAWDRGISRGLDSTLYSCLSECRYSLTAWNSAVFGHVGKKLVTLQAKLEVLECNRGSAVNLREIDGTRMEMNKLLDA